MFIVITGTSCSGKTSIIQKLKESGYLVVEEIATKYIAEQKLLGRDLSEILADHTRFQRIIIQKQLEKEEEERYSTSESPVFLDRSLIDCVAFSRLWRLGLDEEILPHVRWNRYHMVFILDRLPVTSNGIRWESDEKSTIEQEQYLLEAYKKCPCPCVHVPVLDVEERAKLVLNYTLRFFEQERLCDTR